MGKKNVKKGFLKKIGSHRVFGTPLEVWMPFFFALFCVSIAFYFVIIQPLAEPHRSETFTAEIRDLWVDQYEDSTGGQKFYRVRLSRDEEEFNCTVPSTLIKVWYQLEKEKSYEFEVSRSRTRCYINKATEVETEEGLFGVDGK